MFEAVKWRFFQELLCLLCVIKSDDNIVHDWQVYF